MFLIRRIACRSVAGAAWAFLAATIVEAAPIVIAHRGASGYLPEHTLVAKALAHGQGADFIEQDIVLTKDNVPIVVHDIQLDTVSDVAEVFPGRAREDGRFYAIDFTLDEVRRLRVCERRDPRTGRQAYPERFPTTTDAALRISTFEEELDFLAGLNRSTGRRTGVYPEIKEPAWHRREGHDLSPLVLAALRRHGFATRSDRCFVQCFDADEVRRIRHELRWEGGLVQLLEDAPKDAPVDPLLAAGALATLAKTADGIGPPISRVLDVDGRPTGLVAAAHAVGIVVHPYTFRVDQLPTFAGSAKEALQGIFAAAAVDGLFTDFPDVCVRWLQEHPPVSRP
jgi:glycerophosphoryl diester phosphodiesterase